MKTVDVVIPTFERREQTLRAVESVFAQSYSEFEVFVVEDGSSAFAAEAQKTADKSFHYFQSKENRGPSHARNFGASRGSGEFLAFLDSDDLWHKEKLEKQLKYLNENPDIQWVHTNESWIKDGRKILPKSIHRKQGGQFLERAFALCLISPSAVLFRRSFFEKTGGFLETLRVAEDYEYWLRLLIDYPIGYLEEQLTIKMAGNWEQLSSTREIDRQRVLALHRFYRLYKNHPEFIRLQESFFQAILRKIEILEKGATKYNRPEKLKEYQGWSRTFKALRTKAIS